jgi:hypothetical protein
MQIQTSRRRSESLMSQRNVERSGAYSIVFPLSADQEYRFGQWHSRHCLHEVKGFFIALRTAGDDLYLSAN